MAGVPRASLVVIAATLNQFHIPEAGILLLLGIDHFLDMGRSATNVLGNAIAASVVAKSEDSLGETAPSARWTPPRRDPLTPMTTARFCGPLSCLMGHAAPQHQRLTCRQ
jgi:hypothetical protein